MELTLDMTKRYSYADYLTWLDDKRRELFEGIVKLLPAPSSIHAILSRRITLPVGTFISKQKGHCELFYAPFDVRLPKNGERDDDKIYTVVQPDICLVCDRSKIDERGCLGAPDLIIEILSPSTRKNDLHDKYDLYEAAGVKEYWVADPASKDITVFLLQDDGKYNDGVVYERKARVPVHSLPGLTLNLEEIFC